MRLLQHGSEHDFTLKSLDAHSLRKIRREDLHHDLTAESSIPYDKNPGHASAAEFTFHRESGTERGQQLQSERIAHRCVLRDTHTAEPGGAPGGAG